MIIYAVSSGGSVASQVIVEIWSGVRHLISRLLGGVDVPFSAGKWKPISLSYRLSVKTERIALQKKKFFLF